MKDKEFWGKMMYPKEKRVKKRKKHAKSIIQNKEDRRCYLCMLEGNYALYPVLHEHHVCPGTANRRKSEEMGLKVNLCTRHHEYSKEAVHENANNMLLLKQIAQGKYEELYGHEKWMQQIGKNYL